MMQTGQKHCKLNEIIQIKHLIFDSLRRNKMSNPKLEGDLVATFIANAH